MGPVPNKGVTFFVTLLGGEPERRFVRDILVRALGEEGIGGKTAVGYGRFVVNEQSDLWNISRKRREVRERRRRQEAIKKRQSELDAMSPVARALVILKTPGIQEKDAVGIYNGIDAYVGEERVLVAEALKRYWIEAGKWNKKECSKKQWCKVEKLGKILKR